MISVSLIQKVSAGPSSAETAGTEVSAPVHIKLASGLEGVFESTVQGADCLLQVLHEREADAEPVFMETDESTQRVLRLLLPREMGVESVEASGGENGKNLEVTLYISHAKHWLRASHPDYETLKALLERALQEGTRLLVTEDPDSHEILHLVSLGKPLPGTEMVKTLEMHESQVAPRPAAISEAKADEMFKLVNATTCDPQAPSGACMPFMYPDDGCWGRAHEMGRLISSAGVEAVKVWNYGNLVARTRNHPNCQVRWGYHVAVTVNVQAGGTETLMTLDPAMFDRPVPQKEWQEAQGDGNPALTNSLLRVFYRARNGSESYDDDYSETRKVLKTYRQQLLLRSSGGHGPPPYQKCIIS